MMDRSDRDEPASKRGDGKAQGRNPPDAEATAEPRFCLLELMLDADGEAYDYRFLETSPAFDRQAGVESAVGMTARQLVSDLSPEWPRTFFEIARDGRGQRFYRPSAVDGRLLEIIAVPVGPSAGLRVAVTMATVADQRRSEAALRRAHALLEGVAAGTEDLIATEDPDFRYTYFNEAYAREFEKLWSRRPAVGDSMVELLAAWPEQQRKAQELWARALAGESFRVEEAFGPTPEETRTYDLRYSPLHDEQGRVIGAAHIFRDVTARVEAERQLRESARHKDEFLAMLGHELRNPLAAIQYATELIARRERVDGDLAHAISVLGRQSMQMARLVDGLLEVSRIARGKITLQTEPVSLLPLVTSVLSDHAAQFEAAELTLERAFDQTASMHVDGDRARLTQILDNLIANAIKYTPRGGTIAVKVAADAGSAVIRVRDSGIGVEPDNLDRIFHAFHQEPEGASRSSGGLGLGLALARRLTELHDGSLNAFSSGRDQGAEFVVRLPLCSDGARAADGPSSAPLPLPTGLRLLIVEDNEDAAAMLQRMLHGRGHVVETATSARAALERLAQADFDAALCDIGLPDLDGYDLARQVRARARQSKLSLIALTGYGQAADRRRAREAGFDAHLVKPVTLDAVETALREHVDGDRIPPHNPA